jgi:uncharacterized protein YndB with AHSA1/START domain
VIARRDALVTATPEEIWAVVSVPDQLPRWWPGVARVEDASEDEWTTVLTSPKGKSVRADYSRVEAEPPRRLVWRQEVEETPFERILASAETTVSLTAAEGGTRVEVAIEQRPRGWARFAPMQFRSAATRQVAGAVEGLAGLFEEGPG